QPLTRFILPEDQGIYYRHCEHLFFKTGAPQVCEMRMLRADAAPFWARLEATTAQDGESGAPVCRTVVSDITGRKRAEEKLQESLEQLRRAVETTIQVLVLAVETKDPYTAGHQKRTTNLARAMAAEMNLPQEKIEGLRMAGVIHDIGKIGLPTEILSKPTKLSAIEYSLIKEHARQGYEILKDVESPWPLAEMVYQHHERINGSGYPRGLKGEEILVEARILAVADIVEAMASHRPYRPSLGMDAALEEIEKNRGLLYDPAAGETCLRLIREKRFQLDVDAYPIDKKLLSGGNAASYQDTLSKTH
ncbi:MAG: HD domain-containing phosphohydrolase, partial [Thermodesulfobacteriota bacterium]